MLLKNAPELLDEKDLVGKTALMKACEGGHFAVVHFLLGLGANPSDRDDLGKSCLHHVTGSLQNIFGFRFSGVIPNQGMLVLFCNDDQGSPA